MDREKSTHQNNEEGRETIHGGNPMRISIIGVGEMGEWFAEFFQNMGWEISLADAETEKARELAEVLHAKAHDSNEKAASVGDIILISVPITKTADVIEETCSHTKENSLLIDIASVKESPVKKMKQVNTKSELASVHPLFGPGAENLKDRNIISVPVKVGEKYRKFRKSLSEMGANIEEMEAAEHDKLMAIIQSLTHYTMLSYLSAFNQMGKSEKALKYKTPMLEGLLNSCRAFLKETPELCGDIQKENRYSSFARTKLIKSCNAIDESLADGDIDEIKEIFRKSRKRLGMNNIKKAYKKLYGENEEDKE
ncbi:MAG: prephenate dehydrogenase/arogenate dehydrogenase family protein [Candidatus Hadarchaeota archaeon]